MGSKFAASIISKFYLSDFFFLFAAHRLMTQTDSVRQLAMRIIKEEKSIDLIAAFRLIGRTFPFHFALLGRKRKCVKSKTTAKLREKRTSSATVRDILWTFGTFLTSLLSRYRLPLNYIFLIFLCVVRHYNWRRVQRCSISISRLLVRWSCSVHLVYFEANRILTGLYKRETEIRLREDDKIKKQTDIDRHGPKASWPPSFLLPTTFKENPPAPILQEPFKDSEPPRLLTMQKRIPNMGWNS